MQIIIALLVLILVAVLFGPVVGVLAAIAVGVCMIPGVGIFIGITIGLIAVAFGFGVNSLLWLAAPLVFVVICSIIYAICQPNIEEKQKEAAILDRKKIEGTDDLYQDQHGKKWRKVAGIYKPVSE